MVFRRRNFGYRRRNNRRRRRVRRFSRKRRNYAMPVSYRGRDKHIMPPIYKCKLQFFYNNGYALAAVDAAIQQFRGNSLYDPDYTGIGTQPRGYDQLTQFYNKYRVYASSIKVNFEPTGTTSQFLNTITYGVYPDADLGLAFDTPKDLVEASYVKYRVRNSYDSGGKYVKNFMTTSQITGVRRTAVKYDDTFASVINTNPINQWIWNVFFFQSAASDTNPQVINGILNVTIQYYCEFFDRKALSPSLYNDETVVNEDDPEGGGPPDPPPI